MKTLFKVLVSILGVCFTLSVIGFTTALLSKLWSSGSISSEGYVRVVEVSGVLMDATELLQDFDKYSEDEQLKALVVRINSPGGLVAPSEEIYRALRKMDEKIPVVASMGSVSASGGYYAALGARKIFANEGTLTASIGVIMEVVNTQRLYQWMKVERIVLKAGKFKDIGSSTRPMRQEEKKLLEGMLGNIHESFRAKVKQRRGLDGEELANATDGRIVTGSQAAKMKLVDEIGGLSEAIASAKEMAELPEDAYVHYPEADENFFTKLVLEKVEGLAPVLSLVQPGGALSIRPGPHLLMIMPGY